MKTINPYAKAAKYLVARSRQNLQYKEAKILLQQRIRWDRHPFSRDSRKKINKLRNIQSGKKCLILCNGPSLLKVDFNALRESGIFTFGLNKINLLFTKTNFRPSAIVAVNPLVLEQNIEFYNGTPIPLFVDSYAADIGLENRSNVHFLHSAYSKEEEFAEDCSISIHQGFTVTFVAMQLAFHMGFYKVALVGADHYFHTKGLPNKAVISEESDPNHFDPNYFAGGLKWHLPDLRQSEIFYQLAKDTYSRHNRQIINCTEGGHLEIFDRANLSDYLCS